MVRKIGKYELGKTIGEGAYSKVKLGIDTETGERVAIKILEQTQLEALKMMEKVRREIRILKGINHVNVVRLIDVMVSKTHLYIVLELIAGGELFSKLAADLKFEEGVARYYFKQLIAGVSYCHAKGVVHRDLKPENLLLTENNILKISDFGLSALMHTDTGDKKMLSTQCGTPQYVSPEVLADIPLYEGPPVDVWSCGVILFVCLTGDLPFSDRDSEMLFKKIKTAEIKAPKGLSPEALDLLTRILQPDPVKRITIDQVKQHPWFLMPTPTDLPAPSSNTLQRQISRVHALRDTQDDIREVEEVDDNDKFTAYRGQTITNAFELISMAGSMDLTRLLTKGDRTQVMRRMASARFVTKSSPSEVFHRLKAFFDAIPQVGLKPLENMMKLKVNARTPGGLVVVHIHILVLLPGTKDEPGLQLVDFRRAGGDILAFNRLFRDAQATLENIILQRTPGSKPPSTTDSPSPFPKPLMKQESINRSRSATDHAGPPARDGSLKKEKKKEKERALHTSSAADGEAESRARGNTLGTPGKKDKDDSLSNSIRRLLHSSSSKAVDVPPVSPKRPDLGK